MKPNRINLFLKKCALMWGFASLALLTGCGGTNLTEETIDAGLYHTCYSKDDSLYCWGNNSDTQLSQISDGTGKVHAGGFSTCVESVNNGDENLHDISCTGTVGNTTYTGLPNDTLLSIGQTQACLYRKDNDSKIECWGSGLGVSVPTEYVSETTKAIAAGGSHVCAIQSDQPVCWGANEVGQTNAQNFGNSSIKVNEIASGQRHSCATYEYTGGVNAGKHFVQCWGDSTFQQTWGGALHPFTVATDNQLTNIESSGFHTCGIHNKKVICWGRNDFGQSTVPLDLPDATDVAVGRDHTCAITKDGVVCWGSNARGQLNIPQSIDANSKTEKVVRVRFHNLRLVDDSGQVINETSSTRAQVQVLIDQMNTIYAQCDRKWSFELVGHDTITFQDIVDDEGVQLGDRGTGQIALKSSDLDGDWAMLSLMLPNENPNQSYDRSLATDLEDANVENAKRLNDYHIFHGQLIDTTSNAVGVARHLGTWQFVEQGAVTAAVLAHEFGHSVGTDASHLPYGNDPENLMYYLSNGKTEITPEQCEFFWNAKTLTKYTAK